MIDDEVAAQVAAHSPINLTFFFTFSCMFSSNFRCSNPTNQVLTFLGGLHICFQPLFCNMALMGNFRRYNLRDRIESQVIQKLCLVGAIWMLSRYFCAILWPDNPDMAPVATESCPNYEWLASGYDPYMQFTTPNLPGHSCTYLSPSKEGHLAWALPMYQATYMVPGTSVHFFLMFAPYLLILRRPVLPILAVLMCWAGPLTSLEVTPHLNEQPAIWCYYSIFEIVCLVFIFRWRRVHQEVIPARIVERGGVGEETLVYVLTTTNNSGDTELLLDDKEVVVENSRSSEAKLC